MIRVTVKLIPFFIIDGNQPADETEGLYSERVGEIVKDSLYYARMEDVTVKSKPGKYWIAKGEVKNDNIPEFVENLQSNYDDLAADGWMEGDIMIGEYEVGFELKKFSIEHLNKWGLSAWHN